MGKNDFRSSCYYGVFLPSTGHRLGLSKNVHEPRRSCCTSRKTSGYLANKLTTGSFAVLFSAWQEIELLQVVQVYKITYYFSLYQVPPITNYTMKGRTYRYYTQDPLYPFGYGLSYSTFTYSNLQLTSNKIEPGQQIDVTVSVKNNGPYDAEEVRSNFFAINLTTLLLTFNWCLNRRVKVRT